MEGGGTSKFRKGTRKYCCSPKDVFLQSLSVHNNYIKCHQIFQHKGERGWGGGGV